MSSGSLNSNLYNPPCFTSKLFLCIRTCRRDSTTWTLGGIYYIYKGRDDFKDVFRPNLKQIIHFS